MTVDYPLTLPDKDRVNKANLRLKSANAMTTSPFTFNETVQSYPGEMFTGELEIAPVGIEKAGRWRAFLANLDGKRGTFRFGDPMQRTPSGNASLSGGLVAPAGNPPFIDATNSVDDAVIIPDSNSLDITDTLTIEAWLYISENLSNSQATIIGKNPDLTAGPYGIIWDGVFKGWASDGSINSITDSNTSIQGEWVHVAFTYSSTDGGVIYVNGEQKGTHTDVGSMNSTTDDLYFSGTGGDGFEALYDHVRIWSVVRTQSEIQNNLNVELTGSESGLEGLWKFEDTSDLTIAVDSTANGNDGSLSGAEFVQNRPRELFTYGWASNESKLFEYGDYIEVGDQYMMVTQPASSNYSGNSLLDIKPGARQKYAPDTDVITDNPQGLFRLTTDETEWIEENIVTSPMTLPIREVVR